MNRFPLNPTAVGPPDVFGLIDTTSNDGFGPTGVGIDAFCAPRDEQSIQPTAQVRMRHGLDKVRPFGPDFEDYRTLTTEGMEKVDVACCFPERR